MSDTHQPTLTITQKSLAAGLTEWERRYREEPERFKSESERLAITPATYGDECAPYLLAIIAEQAAQG